MPGAVTLTTIAVTPVLVALVVLDVGDGGVRDWFERHAFTTSAITSILVLLITVLIVDRVVAIRQRRDRGRVMAAQAAIVSRQARRTLELVQKTAPPQREAASDELRTYMAMLLVSAPVMIEAPDARAFLESAQRLAALMSRALEHESARASIGPQLDRASAAMRDAAQPLLASLDRSQLRAVDDGGDGSGDPGDGGDQARAGT